MKKCIITLFALLALTVSATQSFAAFGAGVPTQAKIDFMAGVHDDGDTYKCALYVQSAATTLDASATVYTVTGEIANGTNGTAGYTAGGVAVGRLTTIGAGGKAIVSFANCTFSTLTTPAGGVNAYSIYNVTDANKIVYIGSISPTNSTAGTFTVTIPAQDATNGLIRLP